MEAVLHRVEITLDRFRGASTVRGRVGALMVLTAATIVAFFVTPALPQPQEYHLFADARTCFGIPNFANVVSNAAFFVVGIWGLAGIVRPRPGMFLHDGERLPYLILFTALVALFFGSAWYHLQPDNDRLFWDRLPMVVGFGALIAALVGERIDRRAVPWVLVAAIGVGVATLVYWIWTEWSYRGNLMPYALFQAYSILVALLVLALFPPRYTGGRLMFVALALYGLAKVTETFDEPIFMLGGIVSGHTLKHLLAAAGLGVILVMLMRRRPVAARRG